MYNLTCSAVTIMNPADKTLHNDIQSWGQIGVVYTWELFKSTHTHLTVFTVSIMFHNSTIDYKKHVTSSVHTCFIPKPSESSVKKEIQAGRWGIRNVDWYQHLKTFLKVFLSCVFLCLLEYHTISLAAC